MAAKMATSKQEKSKKTPNRRCRSCSASAKRPATASPKGTKARGPTALKAFDAHADATEQERCSRVFVGKYTGREP